MRVTQTQTGPREVALHRATADWGEGASVGAGNGGAGGFAAPGDATWTYTFHPGATWVTPGGEFEPNASASAMAGFTSALASWSGPGLVSDVQAWLDAPAENFGWVVRHVDEVASSSAKRFGSRENVLAADRPTLEIEYERAGGDCSALNHCSSTPNSTGAPAVISAFGRCSITDGELTLSATPVPDEPFLFFHGPLRTQAPFGDGFLCVAGQLVRLLPPGQGSGGLALRTLDLAAYGFVAGARSFQCWYRDPLAGAAGFNTSDAVEVILAP
jgi:hypothetical protein